MIGFWFQTDKVNPDELMRAMKEDGLALKKSIVGQSFDPSQLNQVMLPKEEDPESIFLKTLSYKQKKKLLKRLNKLSGNDSSKSKSKKHRKDKERRRSEERIHSHKHRDEHKHSSKKKSHKRDNSEESKKDRQHKKDRKRSSSNESRDSRDVRDKKKRRH